MKRFWIFFIVFISLTTFCEKKQISEVDENGNGPDVTIVDSEATAETKYLFYNLKQMIGQGIMFGHQDDLPYGVGWSGDYARSDVKDVCGDYPAVYGWDIGDIGQGTSNLDGVDFEGMTFWIKQSFRRGGIHTVSWHVDNPVSGGDAWDNSTAVPHLLPGGSHHNQFKTLLDHAADFFLELKDTDGTALPVIFRPWHEHTGGWFWWGTSSCTRQEYIDLWRFTVQYLRDTRNVHNLLYAYSPSAYISDAGYLDRYPGDDYVDVLGLDLYTLYSENHKNLYIDQIKRLTTLADNRGKVAALTEVGLNMIPIDTWWTEYLLNPIKQDMQAKKLVYFMVWRNWYTGHHFAPYPGHDSAPDFIDFYNDPYTVFEGDLPNMYGE